jgi:Mg-chelatase subunit ChlD
MVQNPGRYLLVLDVSGSMKAKVPGTTKTKLQLAQAAATNGTAMMPPNGEIAFWEFSTKVDGKRDFIELVPMRKVSAIVDGHSQLAVLQKALASVKPVDGTALYDTTLAAYAQMVSTYRAGTPNVILIVTDGKNEDPGSPTLAKTLAALKSTSVADRKVPIYTIGYGADADSTALRAISAATGGQYYQALDPRDITKVLFEALLPRPSL